MKSEKRLPIRPAPLPRAFRPAWLGLAAWLGVAASCGSPAWSADRLLLRNLEIVSDRAVVGFDEDGVRLDDGRRLTWDEIERGTVAEGQQSFDQLLEELGEPLYRIRQRLAVGDHRGVLVHAEAVYPRYFARRGATAHMVFQGLMWARLAAGQRESALEPYLLTAELLRGRPGEAAGQLPGERQLRWNSETGMTEEIVPIWFDASAASEALPGVGRAIGTMKKPWLPAVPLYYASLAIAAGDDNRAAAALNQFDSNDPQLQSLATILAAQQEAMAGQSGSAVARLRDEWGEYTGMPRALACYWLGRLEVREEDERRRRDGLLLLLRVPALDGSTYPDLAAAALDEASRVLEASDDAAGSRNLRNEMLRRFGTTYHARQLQKQE